MFDPEEIKALELEPKERVLEVMKSTIMGICVQLGEAADESCVLDYVKWLQESIDSKKGKSGLVEAFEKSKNLREMNKEVIGAIRQDIKALQLSLGAPISPETRANDEATDKANEGKSEDVASIEFDQFVYEDINEVLRLQNVNSLYKCDDCQSTKIIPRPLISHSCSVETLIQLFTLHLPDLSEMKLLDIGSGLGSILYGAYYFSKASKIYGVELNESFCNIVSTVIDKYNLSDRVEIINADLMDREDLFSACQVVTFNNVFEYFAPIEVQKTIWKFLRRHLRAGTIFVTNPDLVTLLSPLALEYLIESWVAPLESKVDSTIISGFPDTDEQFHLYKVISNGE